MKFYCDLKGYRIVKENEFGDVVKFNYLDLLWIEILVHVYINNVIGVQHKVGRYL